MSKAVNIFGAEELSFEIKFTEKSLIEFQKIASQYKAISDELCRMVIYESISYEESVLVEISRIGINSYIFNDFVGRILESVDPNEDGTLDLQEQEVSNIYKCVKALFDSKAKLLESSISMELH